MQADVKKFSFFCAEHRLAEVVKLLQSIDGVRLLRVFEKHYGYIVDHKDRLRRVVRHEIAGVCSENLMAELVRILSSKKIYGFSRATRVSFSDIYQKPSWHV